MSGQDLYLELQNRIHLLNAAVKEHRTRGIKKAEAERKYRESLSKQILIYRDNGIPVTIISDLCRGSHEIAKLRFDRDVSDVLYQTAKEAINNYKLQIKILENQIEREWRS